MANKEPGNKLFNVRILAFFAPFQRDQEFFYTSAGVIYRAHFVFEGYKILHPKGSC